VTETIEPMPARIDQQQLAHDLVEAARTDGVDLIGPGGLLTGLTKTVLETALEAEISEHLGYDKHDPMGRNRGNSRNGTRTKTVLTEIGPVDIEVPRDRDATFEPVIVAKRRRRLDGIDAIVLSLSARGLTTGEIAAHFAEVYGARVSKDTISRITDAVVEAMSSWQNRPLDRVYPVIFIDAIVVKVRDGQVTNRPVYVAIGVTTAGERDILGLWMGDGGEGAKFWLQVLTELRNRGIEDCCIVVCDGLKGLPDAIAATWPLALVQTCVLHLVRNTFRYASGKDWQALAKDLRPVYTAATEAAARSRLDEFSGTWVPGIQQSRGCGSRCGRSSCPSSTTTSRSAGSSTPRTPSRASPPATAGRCGPAATSPPNRPPSNACTWSPDHWTPPAAAGHAG
jgi:putative transposase